MNEAAEEYYPWLPLLAIPEFESLLLPHTRYWEWGTGASTIYAAKRGAEIWAVEHDTKWFKFVANQLTDADKARKVTLLYRDLSQYTSSIDEVIGEFDLILIDGRLRVECCKKAVNSIKSTGVIVLDNSNRPKYQEGIKTLKDLGFKETVFIGETRPNGEDWTCSFFKNN